MTMRVATFANADRMLSATLQTQARMSALQLQQASGQVSTDYADYGASTRQLVDLSVSLEQSKSYSDAATEASGRVTVMYDTMSDVTDLLTNMRSQLTAASSSDGTTLQSVDELRSAASAALDQLASDLNTQYEGRYLFAGSRTTTAPVDLSAYSPSLDTADSSYYAGDDDTAAVRIGADRTVTYGVTADNTAFEQAFRALAAIANSTGTLDADTLAQASDLVSSALDATTAVQSKLSLTASTLNDAVSSAEDYQDFVSNEISNIRDVDVTAVAVKLTSYQTQLQASYSSIATLQSLSLVNYLK